MAEEMDARSIVLYPVGGEKAFDLLEQNKLVFAVVKGAGKRAIAKAVEDLYNVKVDKLNIVNTSKKGVKKAYVKLAPDNSAEDIATRLGVY